MNEEKVVNVVYNDLIPEEIIYDINKTAEDGDLQLVFNKKGREPMAGIEWFMPTALFLYFIKPYTEAFLQEMGKDHFKIIKSIIFVAARKLIGKDKIVSVKVITSSDSPQKANNQYSISFSTLIKITEKERIKFLFDDSLSIEELKDYAGQIADFICGNDSDVIMDTIRKNKELHIMNTSFYTYNKKTRELMILDPLDVKRMPPIN